MDILTGSDRRWRCYYSAGRGDKARHSGCGEEEGGGEGRVGVREGAGERGGGRERECVCVCVCVRERERERAVLQIEF